MAIKKDHLSPRHTFILVLFIVGMVVATYLFTRYMLTGSFAFQPYIPPEIRHRREQNERINNEFDCKYGNLSCDEDNNYIRLGNGDTVPRENINCHSLGGVNCR